MAPDGCGPAVNFHPPGGTLDPSDAALVLLKDHQRLVALNGRMWYVAEHLFNTIGETNDGI